jgi:hypothetical protein
MKKNTAIVLTYTVSAAPNLPLARLPLVPIASVSVVCSNIEQDAGPGKAHTKPHGPKGANTQTSERARFESQPQHRYPHPLLVVFFSPCRAKLCHDNFLKHSFQFATRHYMARATDHLTGKKVRRFWFEPESSNLSMMTSESTPLFDDSPRSNTLQTLCT